MVKGGFKSDKEYIDSVDEKEVLSFFAEVKKLAINGPWDAHMVVSGIYSNRDSSQEDMVCYITSH